MRINTNASITSGENISYWISDVKPLAFKKVDKDITTEVLVIGGGIAGPNNGLLPAAIRKKSGACRRWPDRQW